MTLLLLSSPIQARAILSLSFPSSFFLFFHHFPLLFSVVCTCLSGSSPSLQISHSCLPLSYLKVRVVLSRFSRTFSPLSSFFQSPLCFLALLSSRSFQLSCILLSALWVFRLHPLLDSSDFLFPV